MGLTIESVRADPGPKIYYDPGFRKMIEDHRTWLRRHSTTEVIDVARAPAHRGDGDLTTVLDHYNVPKHLQWITMRVNDYDSPMQYRTHHTQLLVPSVATVDRLVRVYRASHKISDSSNP